MLYFSFRQYDLQGFKLCICGRKYRALRKGFNCSSNLADIKRYYRYNFITKLCRLILCITAVALILSANSICNAKEIDDEYSKIYADTNAESINEALDDDVKHYLSEFDISIDNPKSFADLNGFDLINKLISSSLKDVSSPLFALSAVCIISMIYAAVFNSTPKLSDNISEYPVYLLPCIVAALICLPLTKVVNISVNAVSSCSVFMLSYVPIYAGVLISCGKAATGGAYSSLMFSTSQILCSIADNLLVPLGSCMMIASIGSAFNELCIKLSEFIKKASVIIITFSMTIFTFTLGLQTIISSVSDSVSLRATKAAIGTFVPVVGSSISDSLAVILGSLSLFKSSLGAYAIICLVIIVVPSLVSIMVWKLSLFIMGTVTEAVGALGTLRLISLLNGVLTILLSVLLCCSAAFIISIALTLSVGG